jgi:S-formylglutathione hydrolase FrmB
VATAGFFHGGKAVLEGWTRTTIAGKPADVFEPEMKSGSRPRGAVIFLHPLGGELPSINAAYTAAFQNANLCVVAPHGRRSWWADRVCHEFDPELTAEQHLIRNVVPWMESRWSLGPRSIAIAGIGMGGQGAIRLGFKYPQRFPVVAGVASAFDYQDWYGRGDTLDAMYASREAVRQDTAVLHVANPPWPSHVWFACDPGDEACYRGNDRMHEKLAAFGVPHVIDFETSAGGHCWEYFDVMAEPMMKFMVDALAVESRRLM